MSRLPLNRLRCAHDWARRVFLSAILIVSLTSAINVSAEPVKVAVASNFHAAMKELAKEFEAQHPYTVALSPGSTGKHYAQITNGAPFALFLAADAHRPLMIEQRKLGVAGSRATYAVGQVVLWAPDFPDETALWQALNKDHTAKIAIAHPGLAPYGLAAQEALVHSGRWDALEGQLLRGESVTQALQYLVTGNALAAYVGKAQLAQLDKPPQGLVMTIPQSQYTVLNQQMILLTDDLAARALHEFLLSESSRQRLPSLGYSIPND